MPLKVIRVGSYGPLWRASTSDPSIELEGWLETVETDLPSQLQDAQGQGIHFRWQHLDYLAGRLTDASLTHWLQARCGESGLAVQRLAQGERVRTRGNVRFRGYCGDAQVATADLLGRQTLSKGQFGLESTDP